MTTTVVTVTATEPLWPYFVAALTVLLVWFVLALVFAIAVGGYLARRSQSYPLVDEEINA